jgi:hypothetical protein
MDPYIEPSGYFGEFHGSMVVAIRDELNQRLAEGFVASMDLYGWLHEAEAGERQQPREPDVYVAEETGREPHPAASLAVADPETLTLPLVVPRKRKYVKIEDLAGQRVVTVIELLSPSNKAFGDDRELYLAKRNDYLARKVNVVEIDLLRGGQRLPLSEPPPDVGDYYVMVSRAWQYPQVGFYRFTLRDPLPEVPVPLTRDVPDVFLPLRACMDRVYDGARFSVKLRYDEPLAPRPRKHDAAWVRQILASRPKKKR